MTGRCSKRPRGDGPPPRLDAESPSPSKSRSRRGWGAEVPTVLVIGAGTAGCTAAQMLRHKVNVVVLEARERTGGRIHSVTLADGESRIDLGASYIHGCSDMNPVYRLSKSAAAVAAGVAVDTAGGGYTEGWCESGAWLEDGKRVAQDEVDHVFRIMWLVVDEVHRMGRKYVARKDPGEDISLREAFDEALKRVMSKHRFAPLSPTQQRMCESAQVVFWGYVGTMSDLSLRVQGEWWAIDHPAGQGRRRGAAAAADSSASSSSSSASSSSSSSSDAGDGDDRDGLVLSGYWDFLIRLLQEGLDIRTRTVVKRVTQDAAGVTVTTADGRRFHADHVICTLPLGVLKGLHPDSAVSWSPPLSDAKTAAIGALGMGAENKVVLRFRERFWPDTAYLQCTDARFRWLNLDHYGKLGVLVTHIAPPYARRISKMRDRAVVAELMAVLRASLPAGAAVSHPVEVHVTRWDADPFSMGAYSYMATGSTLDHVRQLAAPEGRVHFAGEACTVEDSQCVHGAFETGRAAALAVLAQTGLRSSRREGTPSSKAKAAAASSSGSSLSAVLCGLRCS